MRDLRRAFYSLAQVGEEGQFTRRIARWSQMPPSCERGSSALRQPAAAGVGCRESKVEEGGEQEKTEPTLSVAHEALFRVWDTLNGWLRADRKALSLRSQIEEAAAEWQAENRAASRAWPEERILDAVREIEDSGVSLDDVADPRTVDAFLGPTDPKELEVVPALDPGGGCDDGSGRYGDAWRLPLGHVARASVGVRLAILGDRRKGVGLRDDGLPDIDWCRIEGGEVTIEIRANPQRPELARSSNASPRTVAPFWMARYPVTIAQFRAFLDECYRDGEWRLPPGFRSILPAELSAAEAPGAPRQPSGRQRQLVSTPWPSATG